VSIEDSSICAFGVRIHARPVFPIVEFRVDRSRIRSHPTASRRQIQTPSLPVTGLVQIDKGLSACGQTTMEVTFGALTDQQEIRFKKEQDRPYGEEARGR